jgi:hypothetical protein
MLKDFPKITNKLFPFPNYGTKKDSETGKKAIPPAFKR